MSVMNRMKKRKIAYDPYFQNQRQEQNVPQQYQNEQQQEERQPVPREYYSQKQKEDDSYGFGDSRSPLNIAKSVERNPTPPGICNIMIGGRPIDLHTFEDYMVWKVSPYQLRTLLRYHNARTIEEIKNYSLRPSLKVKSGTFVIIIIFILMIIGAIAVFMFSPQLTEMFKGFV